MDFWTSDWISGIVLFILTEKVEACREAGALTCFSLLLTLLVEFDNRLGALAEQDLAAQDADNLMLAVLQLGDVEGCCWWECPSGDG